LPKKQLDRAIDGATRKVEILKLRRAIVEIDDQLRALDKLKSLTPHVAARDLDQRARHVLAGDLGVARLDLGAGRDTVEIAVDEQRLLGGQTARQKQRQQQ